MSKANREEKKYLLYQYSCEKAPSFHLVDGLCLEITIPSFLGCLMKRNTLLEFIWKLISFGKCWVFRVKNAAGLVVHKSRLIGWNLKFSFLKKNEYEIGPCYTIEEYRGLGIYPYVLQEITSFMPNNKSSESLGGGCPKMKKSKDGHSKYGADSRFDTLDLVSGEVEKSIFGRSGGGQSLRYYMFVAQDNISSRRGVEKAGFKVIGYVQRTSFGRWMIEKK